MRHFLLSIFLVAFFAASLSTANAQVPRMFTYQGVVINPTTGTFIPDGPHKIMISIYTQASAGTAIYSETQTGIMFIKGIFNIMIGSPNGIPASVGFNQAYYLGVSVDDGAEMSPRSAISPAPYAIMASGLVGGAVNSVNGQSGAVVLKAGNGTTITGSGDTLTVNSTVVGGVGVQGISNADNSLSVANPNGPTASLAVSIGGITTIKLADQAVTAPKVDATGINAGLVLMANGLGGASWQQLGSAGGLTLPFTGGVTAGGTVFTISNLGAGSAGSFVTSLPTNPANTLSTTSAGNGASSAMYGSNTGLGRGAFFEVTNPLNGSDALFARTAGSGVAIDASIINNINSLNALQALTLGTGRAGFFQITNGANASAALEATTNGVGHAILGTAASGGGSAGVAGKTTNANGIGVYGQTADGGAGFSANSAVMGSSGNGYGVEGTTTSGWGVEGYSSTTGIGIHGLVGGGATSARAGVFEQNSANTSANVIEVTSKGTGIAGYFTNTNGTNGLPTIEAINGSTSSTGIAIYGQITNSSDGPSNVATAVRGAHLGTSNIGIGVWGSHAGGGDGVFGRSATGNGVEGGTTGDGVALYGGYGGASTSGIALQLNNGFMKVSGAHKTAYIHTADAAHANANAVQSTALDYPGQLITDMVIVTHNWQAVRLNNGYGVWWNIAAAGGQPAGHWEIFLEANPIVAMPAGEKFNVLVIKQ